MNFKRINLYFIPNICLSNSSLSKLYYSPDKDDELKLNMVTL